MGEWVEVWKKSGEINVEEPFQVLVTVEDYITFPETAKVGETVDCGYINIKGKTSETVKVRAVVTIDGNVAVVDGYALDREYEVSKYKAVTFPVVVKFGSSGKRKVEVVVYQWKE